MIGFPERLMGTSGNHVAKFAAFWPGMPWSASLKNNKNGT